MLDAVKFPLSVILIIKFPFNSTSDRVSQDGIDNWLKIKTIVPYAEAHVTGYLFKPGPDAGNKRLDSDMQLTVTVKSWSRVKQTFLIQIFSAYRAQIWVYTRCSSFLKRSNCATLIYPLCCCAVRTDFLISGDAQIHSNWRWGITTPPTLGALIPTDSRDPTHICLSISNHTEATVAYISDCRRWYCQVEIWWAGEAATLVSLKDLDPSTLPASYH